MIFSFNLLLALTVCIPQVATAKTVPAQLNSGGFAYCLEKAAPDFSLTELQKRYHFRTTDLLLPYLAVYAGKRLPVIEVVQQVAHWRWTELWNKREGALAAALLNDSGSGTQTPASVFKKAIELCPSQDVFCAALISHNVLRTLGRHEQAFDGDQDNNPAWFKTNRDFWLAQIPLIQKSMISLRHDGGGDRWGEWYHFFGILTYAVHEMGRKGNLGLSRLVVQMNAVLTPFLTNGSSESLTKKRLDRDSLSVAWHFLKRTQFPFEVSCDSPSSYVHLPAIQGEMLSSRFLH